MIPCRIIHLQTRFLHSGLHWLRSGTSPRGRKQSPLACLCVRVRAHGRQSTSERERQSEILKRHSHACIRRKLALPPQLLMIHACWSKTCHGGPPSTHFSLKYSRSRRSASATITYRKFQVLARQDPWRKRGFGKKERESFENRRNTMLGMTWKGPNNLLY